MMNLRIKLIALTCILLSGTLHSCKPEFLEDFENPSQENEIKIIKLTSDSKQMLVDGQAEMEFRYIAYGMKEVKKIERVVSGQNITYKEEMVIDTFVIPNDRIGKDFVKIYSTDGTPVQSNTFKPKTGQEGTVSFYAKGGNIQSETLSITLRKDNLSPTWAPIDIPVMFHVLIPPPTAVPTFSVSAETIRKEIDRLNKIYNRQSSNDPNGGNSKINFVLAKYSPQGIPLENEGLRIVNLSQTYSLNGYKEFVKTDMWDPGKYLNIYLFKFSDSWISDGSLSYIAPMPTMINRGEQAIPGIPARQVDGFSMAEVKEASDVCIMWNASEFFNPSRWDKNNALEFSTIMGFHLGLIKPEAKSVLNFLTGQYEYQLVNGDSDYCPDTDVYKGVDNFYIYKRDYFEDRIFTSFNVMMNASRKNSITLDQATRIREVLAKCPSRWYYKSKWATTGK